jgi:hypothetical protein
MTWIYELVPTCPAFLLSALGSEQVAETGCAANKLTCGGKLEALSNGFFCLLHGMSVRKQTFSRELARGK